jgi:ribonucleoside-diphosphate reductase alpha chain
MMNDLLPIQLDIWRNKYRFVAPPGSSLSSDAAIEDTWWRIAHALAAPEKDQRKWTGQFFRILEDFKFLPGGRIISGAGTGRQVTLFSCFVGGTIPDSMDGIFSRLKESALTMQQGGGIGNDFSTLRPKGAPVLGVGADASGPLSFMDCWDAMCKTIMSAGARRGAMMGTLGCWHPDIEAFIEAKRDPARFRNFNLSVLVTDDFMHQVEAGGTWPLQFEGKHYNRIDARELWDKIMREAYETAEPGVIFIDRINDTNNLSELETISATNPCAEQPLPPNGACLLGSLNLTAFVRNPFNAGICYFDAKEAAKVAGIAVRMLDNVIDVSNYPLEAQRQEALNKRRIGLGVTGLADALIMCGLHYGSPGACKTAATWMETITRAAYEASIDLAHEKGPFPLWTNENHCAGRRIGSVHSDFTCQPRRNSHLISIAPTGTISLFAGNISSGIEPVYEWEFQRKLLMPDGSKEHVTVEDYAYQLWNSSLDPDDERPLPAAFFARHHELSPQQHLAMQAALQPWVDSSISKTVNCPADLPFHEFEALYRDAYDQGLKCCAAFRPNFITGSVLSAVSPSAEENAARLVRDRQGEASHGGKGLEAFVAANPNPAVAGSGLSVSFEAFRDDPQGFQPSATVQTQFDRFDLLHKDGKPVVAGQLKNGGSYTVGTDSNGNYVLEEGTKPAPREPVLTGRTYKLKWPPSPHAVYVTINDKDGAPYEIFIASKNLEHYAWTVALTRMISAIWRHGGDTGFVIEELKAVFDPRGGAWIEGKYVPSLLAAIGNVIECHIGYKIDAFVPDAAFSNLAATPANLTVESLEKAIETIRSDGPDGIIANYLARGRAQAPAQICPHCHSGNVWFPKTNCLTCRDCDYSTCE